MLIQNFKQGSYKNNMHEGGESQYEQYDMEVFNHIAQPKSPMMNNRFFVEGTDANKGVRYQSNLRSEQQQQ